ncbi:hypothetical protein B7L17_011645 [Burkholderia cenocepacia]|uniref:hypothetical protein n=1 Tax=Burkholderia cenocepacia TaxID=95486 RepID=UPI002238D7D1|nr:hypothetical protein [Burkholderia cenocepacia]MCW5118612.1 hypothetical protein [Burkholderia cenocepacia]MCW5130923.1 hypothetical protein [Burkholderia cenocepacia]MCW5174045.1 hypothetical protein [Burkholderia cenocepacia]
MLQQLREEVARLEAERADTTGAAVRAIEQAWQHLGGLQARVQREPIIEALAYRRPLPDWAPTAFVDAIGADPAARHPWAACEAFRELLWRWRVPPDRNAGQAAEIEADARRYVAELRERGEHAWAARFELMLLSDQELDAIERELELRY